MASSRSSSSRRAAHLGQLSLPADDALALLDGPSMPDRELAGQKRRRDDVPFERRHANCFALRPEVQLGQLPARPARCSPLTGHTLQLLAMCTWAVSSLPGAVAIRRKPDLNRHARRSPLAQSTLVERTVLPIAPNRRTRVVGQLRELRFARALAVHEVVGATDAGRKSNSQ
jgi:hypothetical protein